VKKNASETWMRKPVDLKQMKREVEQILERALK